MEMNLVVLFLAALIPLVIGFIWYSPKVFGNAWMKAAEMTEDKMKGANMARTFIWTYVLSLLAAFGLNFMVVHQWHIYSILIDEPGFNDPGSETGQYIAAFMERYGSNFRTFGHGFLHGIIGSLAIVLPVLGINAMFERKSFSYIAINAGFWIVSFALMGGVICQFI